MGWHYRGLGCDWRRWVTGMCPGRVPLPCSPFPFLSLLNGLHVLSSFPPPHTSTTMFCLTLSPWALSNGFGQPRTKPREPCARIYSSSSKLFLLNVLVTAMKSWWTQNVNSEVKARRENRAENFTLPESPYHYRVSIPHPQNSQILQNLKLFEHQHNATSGKTPYHETALCAKSLKYCIKLPSGYV